MRPRRASLCLLLVLVGTLGCGDSDERVQVSGVVRDGQTGNALAGAIVRGPGNVETRTDEAGRFTLELPVDEEVLLRAATHGFCPGEARIEVTEDGGTQVTVNLFGRLEVQSLYPQVGFDEEVVVEAKLRCDEDAVVRWTQTSGPELGQERMRIEDGGRRLVMHTHPLEEMRAISSRLGPVALSRKERADYRLTLETELGGKEETRDVRVTAAAPTTGVYQVPTGADLYLNGGDPAVAHAWALLSKPEESGAELEDADQRVAHLRPDVFGQYMVRHETSGLDLNIQAGAFEEVPRDCGREGCHGPEDEGWETTAHARTFRRGLEGELGPTFDERCWSCHATGVDFGVDNGGLHRTAARRGWEQPAPQPGTFEEAPRLIRRHGSVWCSSCHGPGRILPPQFHWQYGAKFQSGVCATCHDAVDDPDAPHESWHYREWEASAMASFVGDASVDPAEDDPALRPGCASCHSAQGFVAWQRKGDRAHLPDRATVAAVTCTSCHDPHDGTNPSAVRVHDEVDSVAGRPAQALGTGAICATCHRSGVAAEEDESHAPHAPQTDVLLGRGSRLLPRPQGGVHAEVADSCVACHMATPTVEDDLRGRAGGHTFSVRDVNATGPQAVLSTGACASCHGTQVPPQAIGGIRDWDGDGQSDNVGREFERSLAEVREALRERIAYARVRDECTEEGRIARDFVERDALLLLVDAEGALLGDCNGDGEFEGRREERIGVDHLSKALHKVVWDVAMLEKDGSRGRHNPSFTFAVLRHVRRELR